MLSEMLFQGWSGLLRTVLVGVLAYAGLILILRVSGKRTLAKMNAFDLVVTVALGSTLATILLNEDVALAEGLVAFATLIALQYAIAWLAVRSRRVGGLVKTEPALLLYHGAFLPDALRRERVTEAEARAAARGQGVARLDGALAVVLETDGSFSVVRADGEAEAPETALDGVRGIAERAGDEAPPRTG